MAMRCITIRQGIIQSVFHYAGTAGIPLRATTQHVDVDNQYIAIAPSWKLTAPVTWNAFGGILLTKQYSHTLGAAR
jgi:hypothetical protein